ncbi:MAG TPA: AzlC family ABC transporter permease [Rhabdaerophilum sp.]|nr:AzlC family ABC transporter permease [Rhabdaerophilum sp.]
MAAYAMPSDSAFPQPSSSPWPPFRAGLRAAAGVPAFMLMCSLIGVGGLCRDIGYPVGAAILSTFLIWAGPAQVVLFGSLAAGVALPAIAIAISLSSVRFVPMCVSILPMMRRPNTPTWMMLVLAHYVAVTAWVEGMRRLPPLPREDRIPYFLGFANMVMFAAAFATGAGYFLIAQLPPPLAAGLLFTTPVYFTVALAAGARQLIDWLALGLGFVSAPVVALYAPPGMDLLIGGVGMGTLAYVIHRIRRRVA